ncbi:MAG: 3-hydroxyacyl-CoA dehydrogenase/enoyl-CoA hydratase family protein [Deltaproteobacteria bacterium]|nr:3-hydroxyacyl-CoA dehydrogenase/enoyl-CoA hydratase family protein [Deltaproteobacteria bacterium]
MTQPIRNVAVLGAGVMGSGIAAHLANAGIPTVLLDIVPPGLSEAERADRNARNRFAAQGLEKALKAKPAAFFHASRGQLVTVGNLEDDLDKLAKCDLVIEAVLERLDVKQVLFEKLEKVIGPNTIVSSNTSGLPIASLMEGRSADFRRRFLVTHFFNPPRYMKLLELVAGPETDPEIFARVRTFGEEILGKGIVIGKDTPNFVGNRIGVYAMMTAIHQMLEDGLLPEDVDQIAGEPLGRPKSAAFRTADMVGLDTFVHVADNCHQTLAKDEERQVFAVPPYIRQMVERKLLGDKTKSGFYRKAPGGIETLDPKTGEYRAKQATPAIAASIKALKSVENPKERIKKMMADKGPAGTFAWKVTSRLLAYSARRIPEITDHIPSVDDAMKWGYNWELGPFEIWDALGFAETLSRIEKDGLALPAWVTKMKAAGATGFYRGNEIWDASNGAYVAKEKDARRLPLSEVRKGNTPLFKNGSGSLWDIGDGVCCATLSSKANSVDPDVITLLQTGIERAEKDFRAMLIYNEGEHFSVGANLFMVVMAASQKNWEQLRAMTQRFQGVNQRIKYASVPTVAAPYGMTLGGGLEMCLGTTAVQAAAETYSGLVEVGVGVIPGGAGTLNMLWRALEGIPDGAKVDTSALVTQVFTNIALAKVATSADEAKAFGYFRNSDGVTFDKLRLLHDAKARAIGIAESGYHPPAPRSYVLPGESGIATFRMMVASLRQAGQASEHDALIANRLAEVLCGGASGGVAPVTEERLLELECEAFLSLCGEPKSQERMQYMLMNNKPLRN